jgi:hypothetical protein
LANACLIQFGNRSLGLKTRCTRLAGRFSMKPRPSGPVEIFKPAVVWRASQCGWLKLGKTKHGHDLWEKPNGDRMIVRSGVEPLVPVRSIRAPAKPASQHRQVPIAGR